MLGITDDEYNIGTFRPTSNKVHYVSSPIGPVHVHDQQTSLE